MKLMRHNGDIIRLMNEPQIYLSSRQAQILDLVARGFTNRQIADLLDIRFYTVTSHLKNIFKKMGVRKRAAAVAKLLAGKVIVNGRALRREPKEKQFTEADFIYEKSRTFQRNCL